MNDFEMDGIRLGQTVRDEVDGFVGFVTGMAIYRYNAPEARVEQRVPDGKTRWVALERLKQYDGDVGFVKDRG